MDIALARTFLTVAECGSFIDAARRMNITQSTVSARIKSLEEHLGQPMFERSKSGAELTSAGQQFRRHALTLVRVWQHAQLEVGLTGQHSDHLAVGAPLGLWPGFLLDWVATLRLTIPDIAISATAQLQSVLAQRMMEGTLDLAIAYRPVSQSGLVNEHLFDDEFVLATSTRPGTRRASIDHVFVDWGADFQLDDTAADPEFASAALNLDLGASALDYILANPCSGYLPLRLARRHLARKRLRVPKSARRLSYPVYMVYPETRDELAYEPILDALRDHAERLSAAAQRAR